MMTLQERATNILSSPKAEWPVIAGEPDDLASIYRGYIVVLAAIPAGALFVGMMAFGLPVIGRYGFSSALSMALSNYVSALVAPLVAALALEKLAPRFQSGGTTVDLLKLVAYSLTPVWIGGIVYVFPPLAPLLLVAAVYAIYLFYLGLPVLAKTPPDQVVPFMIVAAIAVVVINVVLAALTSAFGLA